MFRENPAITKKEGKESWKKEERIFFL